MSLHGHDAPDRYDIVILGGGPAGSATALALAGRQLGRILLVEATRYEGLRAGESVPPDVTHLLDQLGLHEQLLAGHAPCLGSCASWGSDELGYNAYIFHGLGNGWHLDRTKFDRALVQEAAARGVEVRLGTRFRAVERSADGGFALTLSSSGPAPDRIMARFVVDATGPRSSFAREQGAGRCLVDQLLCVIGVLAHDAPPVSRLTMLEAEEDGWWYAATIPDGRSIVAMTSDPGLMKRAGLTAAEPWLARLTATRHISATLGGARSDDVRLIRAAPSFVLDRVAGEGWLAVGDAAASFDPISSQGIRKALAGGLRAGEAIDAHLRGEARALPAYHAAVSEEFRRFAEGRAYFYRLEQRWPDAPFWKRRQSATSSGD